MNAVRNPKTGAIETYAMSSTTTLCRVCGNPVGDGQPYYALGQPYNALVHNGCFHLMDFDGKTKLQEEIKECTNKANKEAIEILNAYLLKPYGSSRTPQGIKKAIGQLIMFARYHTEQDLEA